MINEFKVIIFDFNSKKEVYYDILPYFIATWNELSKLKKKSLSDYSLFIKWFDREAKYTFWSRCEWEILITSFPETEFRKIDVYSQICANKDLIMKILYNKLYDRI